MADRIVARPHAAKGVLATYIPNLQVHFWKGYCSDVLADSRDGGFTRRSGIGEESFDSGEEGGFACIVKAEEEDRIFYTWMISSETCCKARPKKST